MKLSTKIPVDSQQATQILCHELSIDYVLNLVEDLPYQEFWRVFASDFLKCEKIHPQCDRIINLLKQYQSQLLYYFDDVDFAKTLPEVLTIYRGADLHDKLGICWTMERDNALDYAQQVSFKEQSNPVIFECKVPKKKVLFVANRYGRSTIIIDPADLKTELKTTHYKFQCSGGSRRTTDLQS